MATSKPATSYVIWTIAGSILLAALILGLSARHEGTAPNTTTVNTTHVNTTVVHTNNAAAPRMDVVFAIDATGSMDDELDAVKQEIWKIANTLINGNPRPDIRFGLVFYQDINESFLVQRTDLTRDIDQIHAQLMRVKAGGGGDWPEHVGRGLHEALDLSWDTQPGVARSIYLVGDAPGHDDYNDGYSIAGAIARAKTQGVTIHAIGCSGLESGAGEFKTIAQSTGGQYRDLTYQVVVKGDDGQERSVIYYKGGYYEADGKLDKKDWGRGGDVLLGEGRLRKARPKAASKAAAAPAAARVNNIDDVVITNSMEEAKDLGVAY